MGLHRPQKPCMLESFCSYASCFAQVLFLSNVEMCFCTCYMNFSFQILVPPREISYFSTKTLHFPGGVPKNKKQRSWTLPASASPRLQNLCCFCFLVPPQEMVTFSTKTLHFPGEVPQKPKQRSWTGLCFAKTPKSLFFGTSSGNGSIFH